MHLEPLAIAANMTQGTRGRLCHVALTLANLYRMYSQEKSLDEGVRKCLLESIKKRWAKTDQDSFILGVILNPYIRTSLFKPESSYSTLEGVHSLVKRMWERFFPDQEYDDNSGNVIKEYYNRNGEFSDKKMLLDVHKKNAKNVRALAFPAKLLLIFNLE
jgi:hypothetical protein